MKRKLQVLFYLLLTGIVISCGNDDDISAAVNVAPVIENQSFNVSETQEAAVTFATVLASDPDEDDTLSFSITKDDSDLFSIVEATGELRLKQGEQLDFELAQSYIVEITVDDGTLSANATITINVIDVDMNASPEINNQSFEVSEAQEAEITFATVLANDPDADDTLSFSITKDDSDLFVINQTTGELSLQLGKALDFETTQSHLIEVTVTDTMLSATAEITINVTDVDEISFITTWETTSANESIFIPTASEQVYNYNVNWGDNSASTGQTGNATHTYAQPGVYTVSITGDFPSIYFNASSISDSATIANAKKIQSIENWGKQFWTSMRRAFFGCENLVGNAKDVPDLSQVRDMSLMFTAAASFNQPIGDWDVSNVTNIGGMFARATSFNQPLEDWDVSKVTDMSFMFSGAQAFNQDIGSWDVSNVTDMNNMFNSTPFNQDIGSWNVSNVTNMLSMFLGANSFNQNISNWDVGNVTNMRLMFSGAQSFNQPIGDWDVSSVTDMSVMFQMGSSSAFNQDIGNWDVSNVTTMERMFQGARSFNQDLPSWDVSNVIDMSSMFNNAISFNGDISSWDVSKVTNMLLTFGAAQSFNQDISGWNVASVTNMAGMLQDTTSFNQDLSSWETDNVTICENFNLRSAIVQSNLPTKGCFSGR
ncbi:BspA family leucine-rich repeat surface protein [Aquimarina sp. M1]